MKLEFRQRLLASTLLVGAVAFTTPAHAQNTETNVSEETADVGDPAARLCAENPDSPQCAAQGQAIVVTGSRIASPTLTSASPLQIVDAQDIDEAGVVNIQEVLLENPAFGTPGISRTNSNFSTASAGVALVDLRNLGSNRTLVLVNGRRFVPGVPGSAAVDLNTIPTQFIERIDILTGGASSIYGSDAVAGVVNIIYKDDFEGLELSGQIGVSEEGDDVRKQANLLMGTNFDDGRGNISVYLGYSDEGAVFSRNRKRSRVDDISTVFFTGDPADLFESTSPFFSSFAPQGTFQIRQATPGRNLNPCPTGVPVGTNGCDADFTDPGEFAPIGSFNRTFNREGELIPVSTNNATFPTGFNRQAFRTIAVPTERYLMALRGNYEINDNIGAFVEGTFAKTATETELEPFPLGSDDIFPASGGRFPIESIVQIQPNQPIPAVGGNVLSCDAAARTCRVRNPLVPGGIFNSAVDTPIFDTNGDGRIDAGDAGDSFRDVGFTLRTADFGPRGNRADRTTFRFLAGLEGDVFGDWRWDAFYSYGETTESQIGGGQVNVLNFRNALNIIPDVNDVDGDGNRTEVICADAAAREQGCVPANIFNGPGNLSPAAVQYIEAPGLLNTRTTQKLAGANLSGSLFDLWGAGATGLAVGVEYRKEFSDSAFDALQQAGLNAGNAIPRTTGSFDVIEGYAELAVPLLRDVPFFHLLEARGAIRVSDYSTVGTTYSYNAGLEWAPVPDIRFRAVYARATRAPNIGELFTPPSQTFPPGLTDPCQGVGPTGNAPSGAIGDVCRSFPGVNANIAQFDVFTLNQSDLQGISGFNQGDPNLSEEKSDSYTLGVVINPTSISWLRNFAFTFDYYNIKVEDAIFSTPRQFILDQCFIEGNQSFCEFITRRPGAEGANSPGSLDEIDSIVRNSGGLEVEGFDVTASYRQNLENWGLFGVINARVAWTHTIDAIQIPILGEPEDEFNREVGNSRNKVFGTLSYEYQDWGVTLRGNYIGPAFLNDQFLSGFDIEPRAEEARVGSEFILDVQFRFTPGDNYEFYVGADNVLGNDPPFFPGSISGSTTGVNTNASVYDAIGRRFYAGARLKF